MDTHLSVKGQVVIPAELRRKYRLGPGTLLRVEDTGEGILLKPVTEQSVYDLEGILKGAGGLKDTSGRTGTRCLWGESFVVCH